MKIKVLLVYIIYPFAIATYFKKALENNPNVDLKVAGPYTGSFIPWLGGMEVSRKYAIPPDIPLPFPPNIGEINYDIIKPQLGEWKPDIVLNIDAGLHFKYKPSDGMVVTIGTDPHVLNDWYETPRKYSDRFFNMQKCYSRKGDIYLPYAYSQYDHYKIEPEKKDVDAVLGGMPYENRVQWVNQLRAKGVSVLFENGPIFDEYREMNNRARIGLNWSSMDDLNARAYELPAMGLCPVMNEVPDMQEFTAFDFIRRFKNMNEAVEWVIYEKEHPEDLELRAKRCYDAIQGQTYDARVDNVLRECGF